jgi:hypothetical protein
MIISAPISFWHLILCSGVSSISEPSMGDLNVTPPSLISASLSSDTLEYVYECQSSSLYFH